MKYRKQIQHWRFYRSGRGVLVNRGVRYSDYIRLANRARSIGVRLPKINNRGSVAIREVDLPKAHGVAGFTSTTQHKGTGKLNHVIVINKNLPLKVRYMAAAHEYGHIHQFNSPETKRNTERRADIIGAQITGMNPKQYQDKIERAL